MKFITILTLLSLSATSFAQTVVVGGFGTDGASLESMPYRSSVAMAQTVYNALNLDADPESGIKELETEDGDFACSKPESGVHTKTASCLFTAIGRLSLDLPHAQAVVLGENLSRELYEALPNGTMRVGATTKSVANIRCTKTISRNIIYKCEIIDVVAKEMEMPE